MIQVIERALDILEFLAAAPECEHGLGEIAVATELNQATAARILKDLVDRGYVDQPGKKKGYSLGPQAYALGARGPYRKDLAVRAAPLLRELAQATGETALLTILRNDRRVVVAQVAGGHDIQIRPDLEQRYDPTVSATGRMLLAMLDDSEQARFLESLTFPDPLWPECADLNAMRAALAKIREENFCRRNAGEVVGLAMPVASKTDLAALGMFLPAYRYTPEREPAIHAALRRTAEELARRFATDASSRESHRARRVAKT